MGAQQQLNAHQPGTTARTGPLSGSQARSTPRNRVTNSSDAQQKAAQAAVFVGDNITESFSSPSIPSPFDTSFLGLRATAQHRAVPRASSEPAAGPRGPAYQDVAAAKKQLNGLVAALVKARAYVPDYTQREANREVNEKMGLYTRKNATIDELRAGIQYCTETLRQLREELSTE